MNRPVRFALSVMIVGAVLTSVVDQAFGDSQSGAGSSGEGVDAAGSLARLQENIDDHEKRIAVLEAFLTQSQASSDNSAVASGGATAQSSPNSLLGVMVTNKRFQPSDSSAGRYDDYIWYDVIYSSRFDKNTRSIKGIMQFCDLFGEPHFQIRTTIDDPIAPHGTHTSKGVGFDYNQFTDSHQWMRATDLSDMTFKFTVEAVLFADGTRANY